MRPRRAVPLSLVPGTMPAPDQLPPDECPTEHRPARPGALAQLQAWRSLARYAREQRRHPRIELSLGVRFMGADGKEGTGRIRDITAGGAAVDSGQCPPIGMPIVLYIDEIGRVEGMVIRHVSDETQESAVLYGFAVRFVVSLAKAERIIEKITVALTPVDGENRGEHGEDRESEDGTDDRRRHQREALSAPTTVVLAGGGTIAVRVIDMSLSGVSVESSERPALGTFVEIGRARGRVSRHHERGFAVNFLHK